MSNELIFGYSIVGLYISRDPLPRQRETDKNLTRATRRTWQIPSSQKKALRHNVDSLGFSKGKICSFATFHRFFDFPVEPLLRILAVRLMKQQTTAMPTADRKIPAKSNRAHDRCSWELRALWGLASGRWKMSREVEPSWRSSFR